MKALSVLDHAIRDAVIEDGLGGNPFTADIGIERGLIAEIGIVGRARHEIVAAECVVAPGFIDAHTHDDMELHANPDNAAKLRQGVTTVITGSCGFSAFPHKPGTPSRDLLRVDGNWRSLSEYQQTLSSHGIGTNVATFVGHNTAYNHHLGRSAKAVSKQQLRIVRDEVQRAMEAGVLGVSTGLIYEPGKYATTEQLIYIVGAVAEFDGIHSTHLRNEASGLLSSIDEVVEVARQTGTGLQISHLKIIGPDNWGEIGEALNRIEVAKHNGTDVAFDVYPYMAGSGPMATYFDPAAIDSERAELVQIILCPDFPDYEGRQLTDISATEGIDIVQLTQRIITAPQAEKTLCVIFEIDEQDMLEVLMHPLSMVGSDGIPQASGTPHPRLYGSFPRVLGYYCRERGLLSRSNAIKKMTSVPARRYGLKGRGEITIGAAADLVIFDPNKIGERGSYSACAYPAGISHVLVNGELALRPTGLTGERSGRVLSRYEQWVGPAGSPTHKVR